MESQKEKGAPPRDDGLISGIIRDRDGYDTHWRIMLRILSMQEADGEGGGHCRQLVWNYSVPLMRDGRTRR